jgi:hypothetical protein
MAPQHNAVTTVTGQTPRSPSTEQMMGAKFRRPAGFFAEYLLSAVSCNCAIASLRSWSCGRRDTGERRVRDHRRRRAAELAGAQDIAAAALRWPTRLGPAGLLFLIGLPTLAPDVSLFFDVHKVQVEEYMQPCDYK